jgi:flavin reductase (DIM6/NTAB) family NADH-FMN oxidoreductase RutF
MKHIPAPNADWKPGQAISSPVGEMITVDIAKLDSISIYKLLTGGIVPRPIAFISTLNSNGTVNAAPFSFFNGVASNPPSLMVSISYKRDGSKKDTLVNIERDGEFVVNTVSEWMAQPMNQAAAEYPYGTSELSVVGLNTVKSKIVKPPRIKQSPIHFECKLLEITRIGREQAGASSVVFGEIVQCHIHEAGYRDGQIVTEQIMPLARLGGASYSTVGDIFDIARPSSSGGLTR